VKSDVWQEHDHGGAKVDLYVLRSKIWAPNRLQRSESVIYER
jgi:hypothetical protein